VYEEKASCMMPERGLYDLPGIHAAGSQCSLKKVFYSNNLVLCIQEDYLKAFGALRASIYIASAISR